jgi:hypothetical protein
MGTHGAVAAARTRRSSPITTVVLPSNVVRIDSGMYLLFLGNRRSSSAMKLRHHYRTPRTMLLNRETKPGHGRGNRSIGQVSGQLFLGMVKFFDQEITLQTSEISSNGQVGQSSMTTYMLSREA